MFQKCQVRGILPFRDFHIWAFAAPYKAIREAPFNLSPPPCGHCPNSIYTSVENLEKIVFRASAERVQQVPIYWRIIPFDTKNSFRVSAERVESAPIYWRIIPFIKEAPTDQDCKWSPGK